ncbi:hypothetical protein ACXN5S_11675 [Pseudoroseicyclus sp. H15]
MSSSAVSAKLLSDGNYIPNKRSITSTSEAIDLAKYTVETALKRPLPTYLELKTERNSIVIQSNQSSHFVQLFRDDDKDRVGWFTATEVPYLNDQDDELIVLRFEADVEADGDVEEGYVNLIGVEGVCFSKQLLVSKEAALSSLQEIDDYLTSGTWAPLGKWVNLGLL